MKNDLIKCYKYRKLLIVTTRLVDTLVMVVIVNWADIEYKKFARYTSRIPARCLIAITHTSRRILQHRGKSISYA